MKRQGHPTVLKVLGTLGRASRDAGDRLKQITQPLDYEYEQHQAVVDEGQKWARTGLKPASSQTEKERAYEQLLRKMADEQMTEGQCREALKRFHEEYP